ncbi:hypothetical protein ACJRO7_008403 [Eucalyptus globulus]|uniref:Peptidase metallopeptidase domain-containing protein n=1 Tax=Eucalyptus globulus TaxID=34317 RepID=A0ABD3IRB2_EUCGL
MDAMFFSTFSYLLLLTSLFHAASAHSDDQIKSPFEFLQHLQGCHKGNHTGGIRELKRYLEKFGYLNYNQSGHPTIHADDDDFDDLLEFAVKTYQLNYHLNVTGTLDPQTTSKMMRPRCGVADIINGTTRMGFGKKGRNLRGIGSFHTVSHYAFLEGSPRWPASNYHLTYGFLPGTPEAATAPVARAFATWTSVTLFTFSYVEDHEIANIQIGFARGDHGDGAHNSFDGPGGTLAHAFPPTSGLFHYDADEKWAVDPPSGSAAFNVETVALHEIGHLLGLGHSDVEGAIMYSSIAPGTTKGLHADDIQGIKALYNF